MSPTPIIVRYRRDFHLGVRPASGCPQPGDALGLLAAGYVSPIARLAASRTLAKVRS